MCVSWELYYSYFFNIKEPVFYSEIQNNYENISISKNLLGFCLVLFSSQRRSESWEPPSTGLPSEWLQWLGLSQAEAGIQELHSGLPHG